MRTIVQEYAVWPTNGVRKKDMPRVDATRPWEWSPEPELYQLPPDTQPGSSHFSIAHPNEGSHQASEPLQSNGTANGDVSRRKSSKLSVGYWKHRWSTKANKEIPDDQASSSSNLNVRRSLATPAAFKAYGHWARPIFGLDTVVDNASKDPAGPSNLSHEEVEALIMRVQDSRHGDEWISRLEHPSLPPRPSLWPTPPSSSLRLPPLPVSQIQLNPFLEHRSMGKAPTKFDIRARDQDNIEMGDKEPSPIDRTRTPEYVLLDTRGPNGAQPATYPGVTEMKIVALADEPLAHFPWPFTVLARDGLPVTVQDVLFSVIKNFEQYMSIEEVYELDDWRRVNIKNAYLKRMQEKNYKPDDGIRRVDFLGDRIMFRGLEPAPNGDGWKMFVGPHC